MTKGISVFELICEELLKAEPDAMRGMMMGYSAIRWNDKAIIAFTNESLIAVFKDKPSDDLINKGLLEPFDPLRKGRPLKGWYKSPFIRKDYWEELAFAALESWKE